MVSETIETPFPATETGMTALMEKLAPFGYDREQHAELFTVMFPTDDETREPVIAIIVYDPEWYYTADRIAIAVNGKRLGFGPDQPSGE